MEDNFDWVRDMLINGAFNHNNHASKIVTIAAEELTNTNNSVGSTLKKLNLKLKRGQNEENTSVVWKSKRAETGPQDVTELLQAFPVEIKMYKEVLAQINKLLDSKNVNKPWPEFYGGEGTNILLQDLSLSGFTIKEDRKMDLNHAILSIKELGKYHAMSMIVVDKRMVDPTWFKPSCYARHLPFIMDLNQSAFNGLINSMRLHWGKEWEEIANSIEHLTENIGDVLHELWYSTRHKYDVINHGEYWLNNLLFKYDSHANLVDMRILDWQVSHYNSPCWDLALFLFGSLDPDLRQENIKNLLKVYHEQLLYYLNMFNYKGIIPPRAYLEETLDGMWIFCFLASLTAPPWLLAKTQEGTHYEDDYSDKNILKSFHMPCYQWSSVREQMKKEVLYWMEMKKI